MKNHVDIPNAHRSHPAQLQHAAQQAHIFVVQQEQRAALLHSLRLLLAAADPRRGPASSSSSLQITPDVLRACGTLVQDTIADALPHAQTTQRPTDAAAAAVGASAVQVAAAAVALTMDVVNAWSLQKAGAEIADAAPRGRGLSRLGPAQEAPAYGNGAPSISGSEHVEQELLRVVGRVAARWLRVCEDTPHTPHQVEDVVMEERVDESTPLDLSAHHHVTHRLLTTTLLLATTCMQHATPATLQSVWGALLPPLCRLADRPTTPAPTVLLVLRLVSVATGPRGVSEGEYMPVMEAQLGAVAMLARLLRAAQDSNCDNGMFVCVRRGGLWAAAVFFFGATQTQPCFDFQHMHVF